MHGSKSSDKRGGSPFERRKDDLDEDFVKPGICTWILYHKAAMPFLQQRRAEEAMRAKNKQLTHSNEIKQELLRKVSERDSELAAEMAHIKKQRRDERIKLIDVFQKVGTLSEAVESMKADVEAAKQRVANGLKNARGTVEMNAVFHRSVMLLAQEITAQIDGIKEASAKAADCVTVKITAMERLRDEWHREQVLVAQKGDQLRNIAETMEKIRQSVKSHADSAGGLQQRIKDLMQNAAASYAELSRSRQKEQIAKEALDLKGRLRALRDNLAVDRTNCSSATIESAAEATALGQLDAVVAVAAAEKVAASRARRIEDINKEKLLRRSELQRRLCELNTHKIDLKDELAALRHNAKEQRHRVALYRLAHKRLRLMRLADERRRWASDRASLVQRQQVMNRRVRSAKAAKRRVLSKAAAAAELMQQQCSEKVAAAQAAVDERLGESEQVQRAHSAAEQKVAEMEKTLAEQSVKNESAVRKLESSLNEAKTELEARAKKLADSKAELDKAHHTLHTHTQEADRMEQLLARARHDLDEMRAAAAENERVAAETERAKRAEGEKRKRAEKELEDRRAELESLRSDVTSLQSELDGSRRELAASGKVADALREQLDASRTQRRSLVGEAERAGAKAKALQADQETDGRRAQKPANVKQPVAAVESSSQEVASPPKKKLSSTSTQHQQQSQAQRKGDGRKGRGATLRTQQSGGAARGRQRKQYSAAIDYLYPEASRSGSKEFQASDNDESDNSEDLYEPSPPRRTQPSLQRQSAAAPAQGSQFQTPKQASKPPSTRALFPPSAMGKRSAGKRLTKLGSEDDVRLEPIPAAENVAFMAVSRSNNGTKRPLGQTQNTAESTPVRGGAGGVGVATKRLRRDNDDHEQEHGSERSAANAPRHQKRQPSGRDVYELDDDKGPHSSAFGGTTQPFSARRRPIYRTPAERLFDEAINRGGNATSGVVSQRGNKAAATQHASQAAKPGIGVFDELDFE